MDIKNNTETNIYRPSGSLQNNHNEKKELEENRESRIKESFDLSILHENSARTYDTQTADAVLKDVNYENELSDFSKENLLGRFTQPLTDAQAHLSADSVNRLLQ